MVSNRHKLESSYLPLDADDSCQQLSLMFIFRRLSISSNSIRLLGIACVKLKVSIGPYTNPSLFSARLLTFNVAGNPSNTIIQERGGREEGREGTTRVCP